MGKFIKTYSFDAVKMFVTQLAISIFGWVLTLACGKAENDLLRLICSIVAILFYLFLLYSTMWEIGSKDTVAVEAGHRKNIPLKGLYIALMANVLNFLLAFGILGGFAFSGITFFSNVGGISATAALLTEGMYTGLLAEHFLGEPLNSYWISYFIIPLPALLTCWVSYLLGLKNVKFTKLFEVRYPESDREPKKKK